MAELKPKVTLKKKGEEAYISIKQLKVILRWTSQVDLDLMAFYRTKDGRTGGVFSTNYSGGTLGSLNSFPFIQLSGDAGPGASGGVKEESISISKLDDMAEVYICAINFSEAVKNNNISFNNYDGSVIVMDDKGESISVPLDSPDKGTVTVIAKIDNSNFMGAKLINVNQVMPLNQFRETTPGANTLQISSKITLKKKGESTSIPLKSLRATLTWTASVDIDFHAYFRTKKTAPSGGGLFSMLTGGGSGKPGSEGCVYFMNRGSKNSFPWIYLDQDAGVGDRGGNNEENLYFTDLNNIEHILIVANLFNKPDANFARYDGTVIIRANDNSYEVPLTATSGGSYCIIAHIDNSEQEFGAKLVNINMVMRKAPTVAGFLREYYGGKKF